MSIAPAFLVGPFEACDYAAARAAFHWPRPERFNIAEVCSAAWAAHAPDRDALLALDADDRLERWSYGRLDAAARRLANMLAAHGLAPGGRCAVLLPQTPETAIAHLAIYRLRAVALPLFTLFGEEALEQRLRDAGAEIVITDAANWPKIAAIRDRLPDLREAFSIDGPEDGAAGFWEMSARASDVHAIAPTSPETPALICYTSGTTGAPKGALHAHRVLLGHLPGVQMWLDGLPRRGDVNWTPADWAWMGGLCNVLLPSLYYGVPLVAHRMAKFDPERAFWIWDRLGVTVGFLPPTALKMMRTVPDPARYALKLRAIGSGGEPLGVELLEWGRATLGLEINEFYGQTECNLVCANSAALAPIRPGSMGRATPGFALAAVSPDGVPLGPEKIGEIAVRRDNASIFLEYWRNPEATAAKFAGEWMLTGDEGWIDEEGCVFFNARTDDVITSAGYRIGPSEVEDCLLRHPSVALAGVVGAPDPVRGAKVVAFVVLRDAGAPSPDLAAVLQAHVRDRISPHVAPREVHFVESIPLTSTGKIMRRALRARLAAAAAR